ncbi:mechanosensitive ion channel [Candidatus Saccharibacteria bacterium]|nr:mechanosensitive ion channel [Candidatus Saccharibacteria bacterium]
MQNIGTDFLNSFKSVGTSFNSVIPNLPKAIIIAIIGYVVMRVVAVILRQLIRWTHWPIGLQEIMNTVVRIALWLFLIITILQILGLSSIALAITGSFAVLLLGFSQGISATVSDLVAGLQLSSDKDFKVGYRIKAGDQQTAGIVREMDIKKTRIEDDDGNLHVIPNAVIDKNEWTVLERHVHSSMPSSIMKRTAKAADKIKQKVRKK